MNGVFRNVFPPDDRMAAGTAGFRGSVAARAPKTRNSSTYPVRGGEERREIAPWSRILGAELARDPSSRSRARAGRAHLAGLRERLHANSWPAHAVEIDELTDQPLGAGLARRLTRALVHLADRVAWLAVLRAPWCGLEGATFTRSAPASAAARSGELLRTTPNGSRA